MESSPLVSVVIIAFNSSRHIGETLDSVARQTYGALELIIADDGSTDETVAIARKWLAINMDRFVSAAIVDNDVNTGIAANCNRALAHTTGTWLKLIAADDVLLPGCIRDNVEHAALHPGIAVVFSRMEIIDRDSRPKGEYFYPSAFFGASAQWQLKRILHRNYLAAPSAFIRMSDLVQAGGFDEAYPMMEDLPLWIKMLERGKIFSGLNKQTVRYRVHDSLIYPVIGKKDARYLSTVRSFNQSVRLPLARRLSPILSTTVKIDILVDRIVQRAWLAAMLYPFLWAWAHLSPFRVKRS